jgi:hypothetical protein
MEFEHYPLYAMTIERERPTIALDSEGNESRDAKGN